MKAERVYLLGVIGIIVLLFGVLAFFEFTRDGSVHELPAGERAVVKVLEENGLRIQSTPEAAGMGSGLSPVFAYARISRSLQDRQFHIVTLRFIVPPIDFSVPHWKELLGEIRKLKDLTKLEVLNLTPENARVLARLLPNVEIGRWEFR